MTRAARKRRPAPVGARVAGALFTTVVAGGTSLAFLVVALIVATYNCEDGCAPGSQWAPGAAGSTLQLWGLAAPAAVCAAALVVAVAGGWRWAALGAWCGNLGLLIAWCVFTGVSTTPIDFSGTNSHWMWLAGLLAAGLGGLIGVAVAFGRG